MVIPRLTGTNNSECFRAFPRFIECNLSMACSLIPHHLARSAPRPRNCRRSTSAPNLYASIRLSLQPFCLPETSTMQHYMVSLVRFLECRLPLMGALETVSSWLVIQGAGQRRKERDFSAPSFVCPDEHCIEVWDLRERTEKITQQGQIMGEPMSSCAWRRLRWVPIDVSRRL